MNRLHMNFAAAASALALSRGIAQEVAEAFVGTLPDGSELGRVRSGKFKRHQRTERARSKARQNRRLHPRAKAR